MTYRTPEAREPAIREVLAAFDGARRAVLTTHINADGDGAGSQAALLELLGARRVDTRIVNPTPFPDPFRFLVPDPEAILRAGTAEASEWCEAADLCVVVDTGETDRLGRVRPMVSHLPTVIIDHHPPGERPIEGIWLRDPSACAAGELVLDLVTAAGGPWTRPVIDGTYVAILTDTGSFRFSNSTPAAHRAAADLIERGARPDGLHRKVYGSAPIRRFRLLQRALETLDRTPDGHVAWIIVPPAAYRDLEAGPEDLEGLTDYPRGLEGTKVALLFREVDDGIKVSLRANADIDVNAVARRFGGGGHVRAAGALVRGTLEEVRERVVAATREAVDGALGRAHGAGADGDEALAGGRAEPATGEP